MLGMFSLLPLLKGWEYKPLQFTRELKKGEVLEVSRDESLGWLISAYVISDDAYGGFELKFQGADLSTTTSGITNAQKAVMPGAFSQDPAGWTQKYYRPNPNSTAGLFFSILTTMGYQGTTWAFIPTTIINLRLENDSTQEKATVSATFVTVVITNKKQFIRSLRAVLGMPTIQDIDPALLTAGLQDITQKGVNDKGEKK